MNLPDLDASMRSMSEALQRPQDVSEALERIVRAAAGTIPGADHASITVRHGDGHLETTAATDDLVRRVDELQYELREGPCYDAVTGDQVSYSADLANDANWPRFGPKVAELGFLSQRGIRLTTEPDRVTGLNLYSERRDALHDGDMLADLFASHAGVALGYATELMSLHRAIETRETIGTAIGILMERYQLSAERAFEFLIRVSQTSNTKLRDIAEGIVRTRGDDLSQQDVQH